MFFKTSQIILPNKDYDDKLSKLAEQNDFQRLDLIDEPIANKFQFSIPIPLRGSDTIRIPTIISIKKKIYTIEVSISSDFTKPLVITLAMGLSIATLTYFLYASLSFTIFLSIAALLTTGGLLFNAVNKQTRLRVREWFG